MLCGSVCDCVCASSCGVLVEGEGEGEEMSSVWSCAV